MTSLITRKELAHFLFKSRVPGYVCCVLKQSEAFFHDDEVLFVKMVEYRKLPLKTI